MPNASRSATAPDVLQVRRHFAAPRDRVFAAWASADALKQWHAPHDAAVDEAVVDFRVGGRWHVRMRGHAGSLYLVEVVYREIDPPRRIVLTWRWALPGASDSVVTVEFSDRDGGTDVVLTHAGLSSDQDRAGHGQSWNDCLDRLGDTL